LGVDPAECTGGDRFGARERWNLPPDALVVGHLANNSWEKGTNDLVEAMQVLWRQNRAIHLVLAGPQMPNFASFLPSFEKRCPDYCKRYVHRLGPITDAEKCDFFACIDTFALPSRSDSFGLVLLEAWTNGVPNVGYRAGGVADVIRHEHDGLLVPCGDVDGLANAIGRLMDDSKMRERFGRAGVARTQSVYRWHDKLTLVRDAIGEHIKKTRARPIARTLPTLQPAYEPE
jgi:glycosyltransferase involved in cell wall biosynthesis